MDGWSKSLEGPFGPRPSNAPRPPLVHKWGEGQREEPTPHLEWGS